MNRKLSDNTSVKYLFEAILSLENEEECYKFFEDLCTFQELRALSQRLVVAKMLSEKSVYSEIVNTTKASTATISRVNRSLHYGNDGYDLVFDRISELDRSAIKKETEEE